MKLKIIYPATEQGWFSENPTEWEEKEIEINYPIAFIHAKKWGEKIGLAVYFIREGGATIWHFTEQTITFSIPVHP